MRSGLSCSSQCCCKTNHPKLSDVKHVTMFTDSMFRDSERAQQGQLVLLCDAWGLSWRDSKAE